MKFRTTSVKLFLCCVFLNSYFIVASDNTPSRKRPQSFYPCETGEDTHQRMRQKRGIHSPKKKHALAQERAKKKAKVSEIIPGLFLSSWNCAKDNDLLKDLGITFVVNCATELKGQETVSPGIERYNVDSPLGEDVFIVHDNSRTILTPMFSSCSDEIDAKLEAGEKVLVHCQRGVSRSASFVIAYLIMKKNMTYVDAFLLTKNKRYIINPNSNFKGQLKELEVKTHDLETHIVHIRTSGWWTLVKATKAYKIKRERAGLQAHYFLLTQHNISDPKSSSYYTLSYRLPGNVILRLCADSKNNYSFVPLAEISNRSHKELKFYLFNIDSKRRFNMYSQAMQEIPLEETLLEDKSSRPSSLYTFIYKL